MLISNLKLCLVSLSEKKLFIFYWTNQSCYEQIFFPQTKTFVQSKILVSAYVKRIGNDFTVMEKKFAGDKSNFVSAEGRAL